MELERADLSTPASRVHGPSQRASWRPVFHVLLLTGTMQGLTVTGSRGEQNQNTKPSEIHLIKKETEKLRVHLFTSWFMVVIQFALETGFRGKKGVARGWEASRLAEFPSTHSRLFLEHAGLARAMQPAFLGFRQQGVSLSSFGKSVALAGTAGFEVMSSRLSEWEPVPDSLQKTASASWLHPRGGRCPRWWWTRVCVCVWVWGGGAHAHSPAVTWEGLRGHLSEAWPLHTPAVWPWENPSLSLSFTHFLYIVQMSPHINFLTQRVWHIISIQKILTDKFSCRKKCAHAARARQAFRGFVTKIPSPRAQLCFSLGWSF